MLRNISENRVIHFREPNCGISSDLLGRLLEKAKEYGFNAVFPFKVKNIEVGNWVQIKCMYGCSRYNTSWTCPPSTPEVSRVKELLDEYTTALLLIGSKTCSDFYLENGNKRKSQVLSWKGTVFLERLLFLEGYYKAFSLIGECCALCKTCAYPDPCRFPQERRPSLEAFGIDVIGTLRNLGKTSNVASKTHDVYNYYGMILLD